jgi:hypothetical protein
VGLLGRIGCVWLDLRAFNLWEYLVRGLVLGKQRGTLLMTEDLGLILRHQADVKVMGEIHLVGDVGH